MYVDFVQWEICNLPFGFRDAIDSYTGKQPLHVAAFWRGQDDDERNVESKKRVFMRVDLRHVSLEPQGPAAFESLGVMPHQVQSSETCCLPMDAFTAGVRSFSLRLTRLVKAWC